MAVASLQRPGAGGWVVFFWVCVQEVQGRLAACRSGKPDACHRWGGCNIAQGPLWVGSALEVSVVPEVPPPPDQDPAGRSLSFCLLFLLLLSTIRRSEQKALGQPPQLSSVSPPWCCPVLT